MPTAKVLILTMFDNQEIVAAAVAAGAAGFLPKNVDSGELKRAIHAVAQGKGFLHPDVTMPFLERIGALARADSRERLTEREQVVLQELASGKTTKEIAGTLVVSEETVKTHLAHIYQKLGVNDRVQAVARLLLAATLGREAVLRLLHPGSPIDTAWYAFAVMAASMALDAFRFRVLAATGRKYHSPALMADAVNFKADLLTSAAVLLGLAAVRLGYQQADAIG